MRSASLFRSLPRLAEGQLLPETVSKAFWAAATATSTSLVHPSEILVKTLLVEGLKTLRVEEKQGEIVEIEGSSVLDECSGRTLNPFSVENTGVDIDLAFEGVVAELGRVDSWHHKK